MRIIDPAAPRFNLVFSSSTSVQVIAPGSINLDNNSISLYSEPSIQILNGKVIVASILKL